MRVRIVVTKVKDRSEVSSMLGGFVIGLACGAVLVLVLQKIEG